MPAKNATGLTATSPGFITPDHEVTFPFVPFHDDTPPVSSTNQHEQLSFDVVLKGRSIATIRDSDGITTKIVIFRPTRFTRDAVRIFQDCYQNLVIEDTNGRFTPQRPQVIVGHVYGDNIDTLIVTTENQE